MSLVVAQATSKGPRIVCDTRVRFEDGRRPSFKNGTLKAVVLSPTLTVCFAGNLASGLTGVRRASGLVTAGAPFNELQQSLLDVSTQAPDPVDFLICSTDPAQQLCRISHGKIEDDLIVAYIGDQNAFERFQAARHGRVKRPTDVNLTEPQMILTELSDAMDAVVTAPDIDTVGEICVRIAVLDDGFNYLEGAFMHVGRDIVVRPGENLVSRMLQSVEEGGYAICKVPPATAGTPALGLCFPRARLGMVYLPLQHDFAVVITDVSPNDFVATVRDRYGVLMSEPMVRHVGAS